MHQCIVEQFPQLDHRGYSILRTTSESGRSRDLMQIPMPSAGFSVDYLKSVLGQAKAYVRPLRGNIPLKDNEKVRNFQQGNIIHLKYFLISYLVFAGLTTGSPCKISPWFHISKGPFLSLTPWWHFQDFCSVFQISAQEISWKVWQAGFEPDMLGSQANNYYIQEWHFWNTYRWQNAPLNHIEKIWSCYNGLEHYTTM